MEILKSLSSGQANIDKIANSLFDVITLPLYPPSLEDAKIALGDTNVQRRAGGFNELNLNADAKPLIRPNYFANYRSDGGEPLGTIGKDFNATQPKELFSAFSNCLLDVEGVDFNKIRYQEIKGGAKIRFSVPLGGFGFKNKARKVDDIETRIVLETGFDGLTKTTYSIETLRLICTNGMTVKDSTVSVSFKNTKGNEGKIALACTEIDSMVHNIEAFQKKVELWNSKEVSTRQINKFVEGVLGYSVRDKQELGKVKLARLDELMTSIELEFSRTGSTVWGLVNGVTHATNHVFGTENRNDYLIAGAGRRTNDKAQKLANELVKA